MANAAKIYNKRNPPTDSLKTRRESPVLATIFIAIAANKTKNAINKVKIPDIRYGIVTASASTVMAEALGESACVFTKPTPLTHHSVD